MDVLKNPKWATLQEIIITFLAVSKILMWMDTLSEATAQELAGAGAQVMMRALDRDLPLIIVTVLFVLTGKLKGNLWKKLGLGYVAAVAFLMTYVFIMDLIFGREPDAYINMLIGFSISFVFVTIFLNLKYYFKEIHGKKTDIDETK